MTTLRQTNQTGRCLIGHAEGLRLEAYLDGDTWTIGWGTTRIAGKPVQPGMRITREQAATYFNHDIAEVERQIATLVKVPLTANQFSALASFVYNLGVGNFQKSTLLKKLNAKDYHGAADEFDRWIYAGGQVLDGLVTRRQREKELFLTPDDE